MTTNERFDELLIKMSKEKLNEEQTVLIVKTFIQEEKSLLLDQAIEEACSKCKEQILKHFKDIR